MTLALLGIDIGDLVADIIRSLLDLLVPDWASSWASQLATWLVAIPDVTDPRQFHGLNAFRQAITGAAWGLLSLCFVGGMLQHWGAGFTDGHLGRGMEAVRRCVIAGVGLASWQVLLAHGIVAVNTSTAVLIKHPGVVDGLDKAMGGALALGAISSGLTLGLGIAAVLAVLAFAAALMVMKIVLTTVLCVLLVAGALVIALYPLPQGEPIVKAWASGLLVCVVVPVAWALVFATAGLVSGDALDWTGGLGKSLEAVVKPFVAVACLYLAFRAPSLLLAQARLLGMRVPQHLPGTGRGRGGGSSGSGGGEGRGPSPGPGGGLGGRQVLGRAASAHGRRFAAIGRSVGERAEPLTSRAAGAVTAGAAAAGSSTRRAGAAAAVAAAIGGGEQRSEGVARAVAGGAAAGAAVTGAARRTAGAAVRANRWWVQAGQPPARPARPTRPGAPGPGVVTAAPVRTPPGPTARSPATTPSVATVSRPATPANAVPTPRPVTVTPGSPVPSGSPAPHRSASAPDPAHRSSPPPDRQDGSR